MDLTKEAILVRLRRKMRGISARSKQMSREAAQTHEASEERLRGIVHKLAKDDLAPLVRIVNAAQSLFLANTLPWDGHYHLIPVTRFKWLQDAINKLINEFDDEVENLLKRYPTLKRAYIKEVNDLAQEIPFPTLEQMQGNFALGFDIAQIPNVNDFRLNHVDPKTYAATKAEIEKAMTERLDEAHKDIINRLFKIVARIHEATGKEDGRLFETLITNVEEAVDVLPKLNMKNDPEINRLIRRVRTELSSASVQTMRSDAKERAKVNQSAGDILKDLRSFGKVKKLAPKAAPAPTKAQPIMTAKKKNPFANIGSGI